MQISFQEDTNSLSYLKSNLSTVRKKVKKTNRPMLLTHNGKVSNVFMDIQTFEEVMKQLQIMRVITEGEISLRTEPLVSEEAMRREIKEKYGF